MVHEKYTLLVVWHGAVLVQDAGSQGIGFLLGSLGVSVAMTSEACYKGLPRTQAGDVITFRGLLFRSMFIFLILHQV